MVVALRRPFPDCERFGRRGRRALVSWRLVNRDSFPNTSTNVLRLGRMVNTRDMGPMRLPARNGALRRVWTQRIESAGVEDGVMFGRQTTTEHGFVASVKIELPDGNVIGECRVQVERNVTVAFSFDDMKDPDSIAGHIARVTLEPQLVKLHDDKEGPMNRKLAAVRKSADSVAKVEAEAEIKRHTVLAPMKLDTQWWHALVIEIVGDQMRVILDGQPVGLLKSGGLGHENKPDLKISVSGKQALIDAFRIWSVKRPQPK